MKYRSMMSSSDAIIWNIEQDPQLRSTVMSVWQLDAVPTPERMAANLDRMIRAIPRLRQRVIEARPRPRWALADVDLDHHYEVVSVAPDATFRTALDHAQIEVGIPFDRSRPLWKLTLLTGLDGGKAAIVIKVHHAIADGMGLVLMLGAFLDLEANPKPAVVQPHAFESAVARPLYSAPRRVLHKLCQSTAAFVADPRLAAGRGLSTARSAVKLVTPHRTPLSTVMRERSGDLRMDTRSMPLSRFRHASVESGASLNDTFVSIVTDALLAYHAAVRESCPRLRVHMPVDVRNDRTAALAGNQFVPARITLDLSEPHAPARAIGVRRQLAALRDEPALEHVNTVSAAVQRLGKPVSRYIIGGMMKGVDVLASNVPGPPFPLFVAGVAIERFYGFGPPAGAALNITLFSYDDSVWLGITTDAAAVVDRDRFLLCLDDAIVAHLGTGTNPATSSSTVGSNVA